MKKSRRELSEQVSKELGYSLSDVDDIVYCYYQHLLNMINSMEHHAIYIDRIGSLIFNLVVSNRWRKDLPKLIEWHKKIQKREDRLKEKLDYYDWLNDRLAVLTEKNYNITLEKQQKRKERYEFIKNIEKQESDSGGDKE